MDTQHPHTAPRAVAALLALLLLTSPAAPALAASPDETTKAAAQQAQEVLKKPGAVDTIKRAIDSQGDISPQAPAALSKTAEGKKIVEQADTRPEATHSAAPPPAAGKGTPGKGASGKKALYGEIIIHK